YSERRARLVRASAPPSTSRRNATRRLPQPRCVEEQAMKYRNTFLLLAIAGALSRCTVETAAPRPHPAPVSGDGSVTIDWTIDGTKDPDRCSQSSSSSIDVTVQTEAGDVLGEYQEACEAFSTRIDLPEGRYSADAVLLDASGADRTTAIAVEPFHIVAG